MTGKTAPPSKPHPTSFASPSGLLCPSSIAGPECAWLKHRLAQFAQLCLLPAVMALGCADGDRTEVTGPGTLKAVATPYLGLPQTLRNATSQWTLQPAFGALRFEDPLCLLPAPRSSRLFVCEQGGKLYWFEDTPLAESKTLALDLSGVTQSGDDAGLMGLAFHPEFAQNSSPNAGYLYIHYAYTPNPIPGVPPPSTLTRSRLSRFTMDLDTWTIDPLSEQLLIDQRDRNLWHQGGALFFHPEDGFLYLSVGDEGNTDCAFDNCQRMDKNLFSGVLRIDVDRQGGTMSHPIERQPVDGTTDHYFIPNDNPFVGRPDTLEEFYALGLRSPHRMTYDAQDDIAWIGDVGQNEREELNVLQPAANYQWDHFEGLVERRPAPPQPLGVWTDPTRQFERAQSRALIGGYVYRGSKYPELYGQYLFADYFYGRVWSMAYDKQGATVTTDPPQLLAETNYRDRANGFTSFGYDSRGELYLLVLGDDAQLLQLQPQQTDSNVPPRLSQLDVFEEIPDSTASHEATTEGLMPYVVNTPLWSDGTEKRRWIAIPRDQHIAFSADGPWEFPEGTVFVKDFSIALDRRQPTELRRLETRFLVLGQGDDLYGITYRWNDEQSEAHAVLQREEQTLTVVQADGTSGTQVYTYPSPTDCLQCHRQQAGGVLGVRTAQLNRTVVGTAADDTGRNQLAAWSGVFANAPTSYEELPQLKSLDDETASVELRLRSYWDSNCSMCHGVRTSIRAQWDARLSTPLEQQGIVNGLLVNGSRSPDARVVVAGDPTLSELHRRSATTDRNVRMPLLGSAVPDEAYLQLLEQWIEQLPIQ